MNHRFLTYHDSSISYSQFGNGQTLLICLHGYGEDAASFAFLEPFIGSDFTCIALEMPFHGNTNWNESYPFTVTILTEIIELIWQGPVENAYVIGYSMGGRIALQLLEYIPACICKLILVAPDGLQKNIWYTLSTQNSVGNTLFHYTMRNPDWFFSTVSLLYKLGFINKSIYNFVHFYLDDAESRMLLYQRWTILRKFNPRLQRRPHDPPDTRQKMSNICTAHSGRNRRPNTDSRPEGRHRVFTRIGSRQVRIYR